MENMSYCRFENILYDLSDCQDALFEYGLGDYDLSETELMAAKQLIQMCVDIAETNADLLDT